MIVVHDGHALQIIQTIQPTDAMDSVHLHPNNPIIKGGRKKQHTTEHPKLIPKPTVPFWPCTLLCITASPMNAPMRRWKDRAMQIAFFHTRSFLRESSFGVSSSSSVIASASLAFSAAFFPFRSFSMTAPSPFTPFVFSPSLILIERSWTAWLLAVLFWKRETSKYFTSINQVLYNWLIWRGF